jgi:hypothetical protein
MSFRCVTRSKLPASFGLVLGWALTLGAGVARAQAERPEPKAAAEAKIDPLVRTPVGAPVGEAA